MFRNFKCLLKDVKVETVINMPFKTGKQDCSEYKTLNNKNRFKINAFFSITIVSVLNYNSAVLNSRMCLTLGYI